MARAMPMAKEHIILDTECFQNYWLLAVKNYERKTVRAWELRDGQTLPVSTIRAMLRAYTVVSFNGKHYDMPMIHLALKGAGLAQLKAASDKIILHDLKVWQFEEQYTLTVDPLIDHIDIIEVAPGQASLKLYAGRQHAKRLQDLPFDPDALLSPSDMEKVHRYCVNDLDSTEGLFEGLLPNIKLREGMSQEYGQDLRSKSDAQIAEAVIRAKVEEKIGKVKKHRYKEGERFDYKVPEFISYSSTQLRRLVEDVKQSDFVVENGKVQMPKALAEAEIAIGSSVYRMGIGGLHSSESCVAHVVDDDHLLVDRDVTSYYPSIILRLGLFPAQLTPYFLDVYRAIVERRIAAKRAGDTVTEKALKITINGSFGKFGSPYSVLYSPNLLIATTVGGQLSLLMLIELLEDAGVSVVSGNTDGIVMKCHKSREKQMLAAVAEWERRTGFNTEDTNYRALYSRDVNNFIAVKLKGGVKAKGAYASAGLMKNPTNEICSEAVCAFLDEGIPVEETILGCRDVRKFLTVRRVNGGAVVPTSQGYIDTWEQNGDTWVLTHNGRTVKAKRKSRPAPVLLTTESDYLGKVVRWYYGDHNRALEYKTTGARVPRSEGAIPMMELGPFPADLDHAWYVNEAHTMLTQIGVKRA